MLDFELLRAFVAVADCGGFHRAAERLNLTQSTVSQQIKRLELETKRPLFRRTTRSVALTDDGEMLLGEARRLLQLEEAARQRLGAAPVRHGASRRGRGGCRGLATFGARSLRRASSRGQTRSADRRQRGVDRTAQCGTTRRGVRQAVRSERRKGVWCGENRWSGRRPIRSISFPAQRCRWRCIASGRSHARQRSLRSRMASSPGRSSTPARA